MRRSPLFLAVALVTSLGGCASIKAHQGYIIDADLMNSVQPGVDNRQSVLQTLGRPSFTSQFNQGEWYYISRDTSYIAFRTPRPKAQTTVKITFDANGTVTGVSKGDLTQVAAVNPENKTTPTLGKKRSLFDEIFGNIGTVGAVGGGGGGDSGGRDTP